MRPQNHRRHLLRGVVACHPLVHHRHHSTPVRTGADVVRQQRLVLLHHRVRELPPHQPLHRVDAVRGVLRNLVLCPVPNQPLRVCERHTDGGDPVPHLVCNDLHVSVLPHPNHRVRCPRSIPITGPSTTLPKDASSNPVTKLQPRASTTTHKPANTVCVSLPILLDCN